MTEGNIATWNVKEGDSFSAGDVLLEIETDKATMDVEAQDDGLMFKILTQGGSKGVQVGTRIAVVAETGDDLSTLQVPADEQPQQAASSEPAEKKSSAAQGSSGSEGEGQTKAASSGDGTFVHKHPLLPSVGHLVKEKGLSEDDVSKIKGTGPQGRLLKGDVLAYIGSIKADTPATISARFDKLAHLDLSNIKVAEKKPAPAPKESDPVTAAAAAAPIVEDLEINLPVSLAKVVEVQNRIQDTLGVFLPISTFVARAAQVANDDLPPSKRAPTANELFDQVLGLDKVKAAAGGSRGVYLPQISAIPPPSAFAAGPRQSRRSDIIDVLAAGPKKGRAVPTVTTVPGFSSGANVFSLVVPKEEENRALVFLERCKAILEEEPGRLVL